MILKLDHERRRLYGVALVADEVDSQGDTLSDLELEDAACRAVQRGCAVKLDHAGDAVGQLVASWPLTAFLSAFAFVRDLCRGVARNRAWPPANGGTCANATRKIGLVEARIRP